MDAAELTARLAAATRSVRRLETLDRYADPGLAAWQARGAVPDRTPATSPYLAMVAASAGRGVSWQRVHVFTIPLSDYARYEIACYAQQEACGEQVLLAARTGALTALRRDFWITDGTVILMSYTPAGKFTSARAASPAETARCRAQWETARRHARPLAAWLPETQPA